MKFFGLLMFGGMACIVGENSLPMIGAAAGRRKALREGLPGLAIVQSVSETGTYVNNQPQVAIGVLATIEHGSEFPATIKQVVSVVELPAIRPGVLLPVRYLTNDPSVVAIDTESHPDKTFGQFI